MHKRYLSFLLILMCLKMAFMIVVILHSGIGLGPDEAQYWTWSRQLDFGYYSKPPGIAWQNWLGTSLFGNTELGVRSGALAIGFILPFLVYATAAACQLTALACFWAAVSIAFSPMGVMASFLSITDGGMVVFWTAACAYITGRLAKNLELNYLVIGFLICCGALFKWPMYLLWVLIVMFWWLYPSLVSRRIIAGVALSFLAFVPAVYWNASHEWATFRHVGATLLGGHAPKAAGAISSGNPLEYLGAQMLLVFPVSFVLLVLGWYKLFVTDKARASASLVFCGFSSLAVLSMALFLSLFMKLQGNWGIFAYPTAFVVIAWYACEVCKGAKKWLAAGVILSAVLCSLSLAIPWLQAKGATPFALSYKLNPFRQNVGWQALGQELKEVGYNPESDVLLGDKYQAVSLLSFYAEGQKRAYFLNLLGTRKNQFSFWPGLDRAHGFKRAFFVVIENAPKLLTEKIDIQKQYEQLLRLYFENVSFLGMKPLFYANGEVAKGAFMFECTGFLGRVPKDPDLY